MSVRDWLAENGGTFAAVSGLLSGIPFGSGHVAIGAFLVVLAIAITLLQLWYRRRRRIEVGRRLQALIAPVVSQVSADSTLRDLAAEAGLRPPWRLSLYEVGDENWVRLARVASYPAYINSGRQTFSLGQGVLTWALRSGGTDQLSNLPDPVEDRPEYLRLQSGRSIDEETVAGFRMGTRSYAAVSTHLVGVDPAGHHIGLVAESEQPLGADLTRLERAAPLSLLRALHKMAVSARELNRIKAGLADGVPDDPPQPVER